MKTIRDQSAQQAQLEQFKVKADIAKALLDKATPLRTESRDDQFVERISFHNGRAADTPVKLAKDIRLTDISWVEVGTADRQTRVSEPD